MAAHASAWHPARLLQNGQSPAPYAVIVLNQPLLNLPVTKHVWAGAAYRVAADGGANRLYDSREETGDLFAEVDAIIGDLDSLRTDTREHFASRGCAILCDPDQYSTDFGKAVKHIWKNHPDMDIVAIGGLGGRVDQGVSQLHHLYLFQDDSGRHQIFLLSGESLTFLLNRGQHHIHVREASTNADVFAKYVGILPMQGPSVISTQGLEWDVQDWDTQFGGLVSTSNHILPDTRVVQVTTDRPVIFTVALKATET